MPNDSQPLAIFRADAAPELGVGHVARCAGLAEALFDRGWAVRFAAPAGTRETAAFLAPPLDGWIDLEAGADEAEEIAALMRREPQGCDALIVDHYGRTAAFERGLAGWAGCVLAIDDAPSRPHDCNILIDTTWGRAADAYRKLVRPNAAILVGTDYVLLRRALRAELGADAKTESTPPRLLLSFGGTDPHDATGLALDALAKLDRSLAVTVVLGPDAPAMQDVKAQCARLGATLHVGLAPADMARALVEADIVLGAAGTSSWERCALGKPSIAIPVADNQADIASALSASGAALVARPIGERDAEGLSAQIACVLNDPSLRMRMGQSAKALCDGRGADRVVDAVEARLADRTQARRAC